MNSTYEENSVRNFQNDAKCISPIFALNATSTFFFKTEIFHREYIA